MFFKWIKKIKCIPEIKGQGNKLYLYVDKNKTDERYLRELLSLFYRYDVDMKQLSIFLDESNKEWFFNNKEAFWYKKVL